jgi:hypothetical protein
MVIGTGEGDGSTVGVGVGSDSVVGITATEVGVGSMRPGEATAQAVRATAKNKRTAAVRGGSLCRGMGIF